MPSQVLAPEWLQWQLAEGEPCLPSPLLVLPLSVKLR